MNAKNELVSNLKRLRMPGISHNLDMRLREAHENDLGCLEFLQLVIQDEMVSREANNLKKRINAAGFSRICTFEEFDFKFNGDIMPASMIRDLASCHFVEKQNNCVLCGPPGIGKSFIAQAIGHEACRREMDVIFRKMSKLVEQLSDPLYPKRASRLLKKALKCELLILDDFAFRKYSQEESEIIYTLADERLGKKSTIITSNRPPQDWYTVFPDPVIGGAIMDRLVSGAIKIISTKGRSYRKEGKSLDKQA